MARRHSGQRALRYLLEKRVIPGFRRGFVDMRVPKADHEVGYRQTSRTLYHKSDRWGALLKNFPIPYGAEV